MTVPSSLSNLNLTTFNKIYPLLIQKYNTLVPDPNANILDKINSIIDYLNSVGNLSNEVVDNWNKVMAWTMADGLTTDVNNKIEAMNTSGELNSILTSLFNAEIGDLSTLTTNDKSKVVNAINEVETNTKTNAASLASIATYINADKTGVQSAVSAINTAITNANDGDTIHFHPGTYNIDSPILWNKKVTLIADGNVNLKATQTMDAMIIASGFTTYTEVHLDNFHFDANNKANYCIKLNGNTNSNYIVKTGILNCSCINAVLDGIIITPSAWTITIKNTYSSGNGRDGIRSIVTSAPGNNQLNHIRFDTCTLNNNVACGINLLGVINSVVNCDIENNNIGINFDATQCVDAYSSFHVNIDKNYIEGNKTNQIYFKTNTGGGIYANVTENYLNSANLGGAIILCSGTNQGITLNYDKNRFETSNNNTILDGGNALDAKSIIADDIYLHESKFINLGMARVLWDYFKTIPLPLSTNYGVGLASLTQTANVLSLSTKRVYFPVPEDVTFKFLHSIYMNVVSDCTAYTIRITITVYDLNSGNVTNSTYFDYNGANNSQLGEYIVNNFGYYRIGSGQMVYVDFNVTSTTGGTSLTFETPFLKVV